MMFDPPDFPYKELSDTLRDHYDSDYLLFNSDAVATDSTNINKDLADVADQMLTNVGNQIVFDSTKTLNEGELSFLTSTTNIEQNTELFIVQSDNLLNNFEPTLLDDNTVNQFLLPLQVSANGNKDTEDTGPDLLALHSCVICHEIFTTDSDLLDHTISFHTTDPVLDTLPSSSSADAIDLQPKLQDISHPNDIDFESYWLVCGICERVLSTALETEPTEQLCCTTSDGKTSVSPRKLLTMYVCDFCNGLFADADALDRHRLTCFVPDQSQSFYPPAENSSATTNDQLCCACDTCGKRFSTIEELKVHTIGCSQVVSKRDRRSYTNATSSKMWNCGSCNQLFATARELYRHKRGEDRPSGAPLMAYVCEECDKVLGSMCALHTHKKMHKVSKPGYPCRVCGRRFNQSGHLAIHMRMHTGERPYPCDLCPKAFKVKVERDDHRRTHTGERPFACSACPKTFTAAARLREHARIHTDQRPYRCDICGAAFRRPYARTVHTLIHTGEKPHECDVCGTTFRRSGDMWKHKRTLHGVQASGEAELKS
ncbi:zinc finger protein 271-like [Cydia amplana]|uniref:zinc finger protein 271-like n=1 Tax=Cydia amplana TaxID=1869771 RepID=UPI002FE5117A